MAGGSIRSIRAIRVICGPTAAGKSRIALGLALEYGATIISADSRQIYRGFDIGTAKPGTPALRTVPHRGIDVAEPTDRYSASAWATQAREWIREAVDARRVPLIVGGTGFYMRALFEPLFDAPRLDAAARQSLERVMNQLPLGELRRWCETLDKSKAHLGRVQLSRAIETALLTGHRLSDLQRASARAHAGMPQQFHPHYLVVDPGARLAKRIEERVDEMLDAGWLDEVRSLEANVPGDAPAWKASGYRVVRDLAAGRVSLSSARERIIIETRQYAKRQRTWFRHQLGAASVTRIDPDQPGCEAAVERWWKEAEVELT
ncbi:MAG TPA: tRNA (adenosine(37)-N6)-dimethylallyltransferase MiaA [Rhodothermia bacterium]|nr:tRNA (adenosine(37)-N6)-dimethylallyltransferase MiaA [Rhodothermia bacterium]